MSNPIPFLRGLIVLPVVEYWRAAARDGVGPYLPDWESNDGQNTDDPTGDDESGSNQVYASAVYPDARIAFMAKHFCLPADWYAAAGIDLRIVWKTPATSGNIAWQIRTAFVADNVDPDVAFNAAQIVVDAAKGTNGRLNVAALAALTLTGAAAGSLMFLQIKRDPAHASDTLGLDVALIGVEITYRRLVTLG